MRLPTPIFAHNSSGAHLNNQRQLLSVVVPPRQRARRQAIADELERWVQGRGRHLFAAARAALLLADQRWVAQSTGFAVCGATPPCNASYEPCAAASRVTQQRGARCMAALKWEWRQPRPSKARPPCWSPAQQCVYLRLTRDCCWAAHAKFCTRRATPQHHSAALPSVIKEAHTKELTGGCAIASAAQQLSLHDVVWNFARCECIAFEFWRRTMEHRSWCMRKQFTTQLCSDNWKRRL